MASPYRKITKRLRIDFVSLCPRGKNFLPALYKGLDPTGLPTIALLKASPAEVEEGVIRALVYVPGAVDADGEFAEREVVKAMAYDHARRGHKLDLQHDGQPLTVEQAHVVESFIVQKGDPRFADSVDVNGNKVDPTDGWGMVIKLEDPELRRLYKEGRWSGLSMGGAAEREPAEVVTKSEEDDMTDEQMAKLAETIAKSVAAAVAPPKPAPVVTPAPETPVFKAPKTLAEVRAHRERLEREALEKDVDWTNPESVKKYEEALAARDKAPEKPTSNQPVLKGQPKTEPETEQDEILAKGYALGSAMAAFANKQRGHAVPAGK